MKQQLLQHRCPEFTDRILVRQTAFAMLSKFAGTVPNPTFAGIASFALIDKMRRRLNRAIEKLPRLSACGPFQPMLEPLCAFRHEGSVRNVRNTAVCGSVIAPRATVDAAASRCYFLIARGKCSDRLVSNEQCENNSGKPPRSAVLIARQQ